MLIQYEKQLDDTSKQPYFTCTAPGCVTAPASGTSGLHSTNLAQHKKTRVAGDCENAYNARGLNEHHICSDDGEVVLVCRYGFCSTEYECGRWKRCVEGPARCV